MNEKNLPVIQGDVLLFRVFDLEPGMEKLVGKEIVLATGESGNVHVAEKVLWLEDALKEINSNTPYVGARGIVVTQATRLLHRADTIKAKSDTHHDPITLEPGIYYLRLQEEHDYTTKQPTPVWD